MQVNLLTTPRRWVLVLVTALFLAATAAAAPIWLDAQAGTTLTPAVYACPAHGTGCG